MPRSGTILQTTFEKYEVIEAIGNGGAGDVFSAKNEGGEIFAAKILRANQPRAKLSRFKNELAFCMNNTHANIIRITDHGILQTKDGSQPFYVMPLYEETLADYIHRALAPEERLRTFVKIMDGVEAAHLKNIFHRDLKPQNILVNPSKEEVVVADFGIAHFEEDSLIDTVETTQGDRLASWEYAAPEQRRAGTTVDHRADIYSLGLILCEIFTGIVPHGADPVKVEDTFPNYAYLDELIDYMRQNSLEKRPASIGVVKQELIARNHDFIQRQRLDTLKNTIIPTTTVSDPLIDTPVKITDFDYDNGELILTLNPTPNQLWMRQFLGMRDYSAIMGSGPDRFRFIGNTARVPVNEHAAVQVSNHAKNYVQQTNRDYAVSLEQTARIAEEEQRTRLRQQLEQKTREIEVRERLRAQMNL